ncbi:short-chain dehydrogenase reductase sdr [Pyrenophora tritici-repentis]|nr:short-chain dehydrogenase reductase sdr [Pyrenophora tritici-repentis]
MSPFRPSAHALITGGASGIGHAVARLCLSHSMHVTLVDNSASALSHAQTTLQDLAKEKNATLSIICADVSSRSDWARIKQIVNGAQNAGNTPTNTTPKPDGAWSADQVAEYMYEKMQENKFYIVCPDGQVTEEMDRKRMLWSVGDVVEGRPPLSRWREEWKGEVERWMEVIWGGRGDALGE